MAPIRIHSRRPDAASWHNSHGQLFDKDDAVLRHQTLLHDSSMLEMGYHDEKNKEEEGDAEEGEGCGPNMESKNRTSSTTEGPNKSSRPIRLRDLKVGKVHRGTILHGVLCCKSIKFCAGFINVFEEDGTGDAVKLVISGRSGTDAMVGRIITSVKSQALYPEGAHISVLEPYLKCMEDDGSGGSGALGLVVEHPLSNITFRWVPPPASAGPCQKENSGQSVSLPLDSQNPAAQPHRGVRGEGRASSCLDPKEEVSDGSVRSDPNRSLDFQPLVSSSGRKCRTQKHRSTASSAVNSDANADVTTSAASNSSQNENLNQTAIFPTASNLSSSGFANSWTMRRKIKKFQKGTICESRSVILDPLLHDNDSSLQHNKHLGHEYGPDGSRVGADTLLESKASHNSKLGTRTKSKSGPTQFTTMNDQREGNDRVGTAYRVVLSTEFKDGFADIDFMDGEAALLQQPDQGESSLGKRADLAKEGFQRPSEAILGETLRQSPTAFALQTHPSMFSSVTGSDLGQKESTGTSSKENYVGSGCLQDARLAQSADALTTTPLSSVEHSSLNNLIDAADRGRGSKLPNHSELIVEISPSQGHAATATGVLTKRSTMHAPEVSKASITQEQVLENLESVHSVSEDSAVVFQKSTSHGRLSSTLDQGDHEAKTAVIPFPTSSLAGVHGRDLNRTLAVQEYGEKDPDGKFSDCLSPLSREDPDVSPSTLRMLGNKHFAQQEWAEAIEFYTQATFKAIQRAAAGDDFRKENISPNCACHYTRNTQECNGQSGQMESLIQKQRSKDEMALATGEMVLDYSNRAEAWLRLHQYERAWADAERALSLHPNHLQSLFRKGKALLGIGDYKLALTYFQAARSYAPLDEDILAAVRLSQIAEKQSSLGIYDLKHFYLKGRFDGDIPSCADYVGSVQIKYCKNSDKGRGLFLTKDVRAGDLILVANPFVMLEVENDNEEKRRGVTMKGDASGIGFNNNRMNSDVMDGLVTALKSKVSKRDYERLLALNSDRVVSCELPAAALLPSIDLFISSGREVPLVSSSGSPAHHHTDESDLYQIVTSCTIEKDMVWSPMENVDLKVDSIDQKDTFWGSQDKCYFYGIWLLPSFINHSCVPNVSLVVLGRALFLYASKDLSAGEELLSGYFNVFQPVTQRREVASMFWKFICKCPRCCFEAELIPSLERISALHLMTEPHPTLKFQISLLACQAPIEDMVRSLDLIESIHEAPLKLNLTQKNWLRASYVQVYLAGGEIVGMRGQHAVTFLHLAFDGMVSVCPSGKNTLEVGLLVRDSVKNDEIKGRKASSWMDDYKSINDRLLRVCKAIFGKHRHVVLQSLVDGAPPSPRRTG